MKTSTCFLLCFLLSQILLAQSPMPKGFKEQQWRANRLKFLLPTSMKVVTDTKEGFSAENNRIEFHIDVLDEEEVKDAEDIKDYMKEMSELLKNPKAPQKTFLPEFDAWILEGDFLDKKVIFCILLDPKNPSKNYHISVIYDKNVSKETAITIIGTITKI